MINWVEPPPLDLSWEEQREAEFMVQCALEAVDRSTWDDFGFSIVRTPSGVQVYLLAVKINRPQGNMRGQETGGAMWAYSRPIH